MTTSTKILILDKLDYSLHFFYANIIASFNKRIRDKWATTSIVVVVIWVQGEVDSYFKLIVVDGDSPDDVQTVCIQTF
jgi:hypothetical protein